MSQLFYVSGYLRVDYGHKGSYFNNVQVDAAFIVSELKSFCFNFSRFYEIAKWI